jgi:hypothetical protein
MNFIPVIKTYRIGLCLLPQLLIFCNNSSKKNLFYDNNIAEYHYFLQFSAIRLTKYLYQAMYVRCFVYWKE